MLTIWSKACVCYSLLFFIAYSYFKFMPIADLFSSIDLQNFPNEKYYHEYIFVVFFSSLAFGTIKLCYFSERMAINAPIGLSFVPIWSINYRIYSSHENCYFVIEVWCFLSVCLFLQTHISSQIRMNRMCCARGSLSKASKPISYRPIHCSPFESSNKWFSIACIISNDILYR